MRLVLRLSARGAARRNAGQESREGAAEEVRGRVLEQLQSPAWSRAWLVRFKRVFFAN